MKRTDYILIGVVLMIIAVAVLSTGGTKAEEDLAFPVTLAGEVGLNEITYNQYKDLVKSNEPFIVIIERTGCGYCQMYMPIVEEVAKEKKIAITYINTDNITQDELNELSTTNRYLKKNQWGTPTTLFMAGDRVVDSISGYVEKESFEAFIKDRVVVGE